MTFLFALLIWLFGPVVPMQPLPYVAPHGQVQTIPDPLPYTDGPFTYMEEWGPGR